MADQAGTIQLTLKFKDILPKPTLPSSHFPWITVEKGNPYFITANGESWTPIGQNDAITWPELKGVFLRKDFKEAETYLRMLSQKGVTCLRLMLEYCQGEHRYFENPAGHFQPHMVQMWDDIFSLCMKYGIRVLLTPYDTFWMWQRWKHHPYKKTNGGPCGKRSEWLLCRETRTFIKKRFAFATERWGGNGAVFAWDLWNEIHPAHAGDSIEPFAEFIEDISFFLKETEIRLHGRAHLQTVSVFGPVLYKNPGAAKSIFRNPVLDFASSHFYESGTIDYPKNTVEAALTTGRLTREALAHINDNRPFLDSEHGPIHLFKDKYKTLPELFDDEYFRHIQWAHFASGGAGGGMRWPNRHPHSLTRGMREAQQNLSRFLPLINWQKLRRRNLNNEIKCSAGNLAVFGCGDEEQAIIWLMRLDVLTKEHMLNQQAETIEVALQVPGIKHGLYKIVAWNTFRGEIMQVFEKDHLDEPFFILPKITVTTDIAVAVSHLR